MRARRCLYSFLDFHGITGFTCIHHFDDSAFIARGQEARSATAWFQTILTLAFRNASNGGLAHVNSGGDSSGRMTGLEEGHYVRAIGSRNWFHGASTWN